MADNPDQSENEAGKIPPPIKIKSADKKSDTARIDLASAKPPSHDTTKLDATAAKPPPSIIDKKNLPADADDYFKRSTMRIDVPGYGADKSDTAKIDASAAASDAAKKKTSKIDLSAVTGQKEDAGAKGVPVGIPARPGMPPRPKTIQMKRPAPAAGESIIVSPETTASATEQARKSETARIDLSAEDVDRPATRPKTIRIKRPDGTSGRKALTISRPDAEAAPAPVVEAGEVSGDEETASPFVGVMALMALLVACVLVYVLLAQTFAPTLPFPGRI